MSKLHELLAVERDLKNQAEKATADLANTFEKKRQHFAGLLQTFNPLEEDKPPMVESVVELQTTVPREINWLRPFVTKALDAGYQVAEANTNARGDIILEDGTVLAEKVPATALLELEKRCAELFAFLKQIPTVDPAKGFAPDAEKGDDVFQARPLDKPRTKKENKVVTLFQGNDKHPPQVQVFVEDVPTGTIHLQEWSGLITTARKADLLTRIEDLTRATKQARSRANEQEIDVLKVKVGKKILDWLFR